MRCEACRMPVRSSGGIWPDDIGCHGANWSRDIGVACPIGPPPINCVDGGVVSSWEADEPGIGGAATQQRLFPVIVRPPLIVFLAMWSRWVQKQKGPVRNQHPWTGPKR